MSTDDLSSKGETRFTPGPWKADDFGCVFKDGDGGNMVGSFNMMRPGGGNPMEARANGILAAAAPSLYEALALPELIRVGARVFLTFFVEGRGFASVEIDEPSLPFVEAWIVQRDAALSLARGQTPGDTSNG